MEIINLPKYIVIKSHEHPDKGNAYYDKGGSVVLGEPSVFSELVKIEVERAKVLDGFVNLRFCSSNKYWTRDSSGFIVAKSNKPQEDSTKPGCTLFQAAKGEGGTFYLSHVPSSGRLLLKEPDMAFFVAPNPPRRSGFLTFVYWDTLVKLPEHVAFSYDGCFLRACYKEKHYYLKFDSKESNYDGAGHRVFLMPDGHVRIKSDHWGLYWRRSPNWIWADANDHTAANKDTLFWPVRIDENTITLRNAGNNNFCKPLTVEGKVLCLNAAEPSMTKETKLVVKELVSGKKINNVKYRMEDARIYDETPYLAGTTTATNEGDEKNTVSVEISFQNQTSYTFSNSLSVSAGVKNTIEAGVPGIAGDKLEVNFQITDTMTWGKTTTKTSSVKAAGGVTVPARSKVVVRYVGTMGTCNVPFTYTQQVRSSVDGSITETDLRDGVFTGVNCYNFDFVMEKPQPLISGTEFSPVSTVTTSTLSWKNLSPSLTENIHRYIDLSFSLCVVVVICCCFHLLCVGFFFDQLDPS